MEEEKSHHLLRKDALGTYDAMAQSVALLALVLSVATSTSLVAGAAGAAAPLAFMLAGLGCLCLAYVFIRFARFLPGAGGIYLYIVHGLGPVAGFLGGWLYAGAWTFGLGFVVVITVIFLSALLAAIHIAVHWFLLYVMLMGVAFLLAFFDVRISTRLQLVLSAVGLLAVLALVVAILVQGGASGHSLTPFSPAALPTGLSGLLFATIFGFTSYIGFEGAIVLGEETVNPQRAIPRAVLIAMLVGIIFFALVGYSFSIGYGVTHAGVWASDQAPLDTLGHRYVGPVLTTIIDLMVVAAGLMSILANLTMTPRMLYAMGRDGGLPALFGRTHPRYKTPWVALLFVTLITVVLGAVLGLPMGPFTFFSFLITTGAVGVLLAYVIVALSGIVFFWRSERRSKLALVRVLDVVLPVIAICLCGGAIFSSVWPVPPAPLNLAPYLVAAWLILGLGLVGWLWTSRRELVYAFGKILAGSSE